MEREQQEVAWRASYEEAVAAGKDAGAAVCDAELGASTMMASLLRRALRLVVAPTG